MSFIETDINLPHPLKPMERAEGSQNLHISDSDENTVSTPRRSRRVMAKSELNATMGFSDFKTPAGKKSTKKNKRATIAVATAQTEVLNKKTPLKLLRKQKTYDESEGASTTDDELIGSGSRKRIGRKSVKKTSESVTNGKLKENGFDTTFESVLQTPESINNKTSLKKQNMQEEAGTTDDELIGSASKKGTNRKSLKNANNNGGIKENVLNTTFDAQVLPSTEEEDEDSVGATCLGYFDKSNKKKSKVDSSSFTIETETNAENKEIDSSSFTIETKSEENKEESANKQSDSLITEDSDSNPAVSSVHNQNNLSGIGHLTDDDDENDKDGKADNDSEELFTPKRISLIDLTDSPAVHPAKRSMSKSPRQQEAKKIPIKGNMVHKSTGAIKKAYSSAKKERIMESVKEIIKDNKKVSFAATETKVGSATKFKKTPFKGENNESK